MVRQADAAGWSVSSGEGAADQRVELAQASGEAVGGDERY